MFNKRFVGLSEKYGFRDKFEQAQKIVDKVFASFTKWYAGDGDGNDNSTRETLAVQIESGKTAIKKIYISELVNLETLISKVASFSGLNKQIEKLKNDISEDGFKSKQELLNEVDGLLTSVANNSELKKHKAGFKAIKNEVELLKNGVNTFGIYFGATDLRHESETIHWTVAKISDQAKKKALNAGDIDSANKFLSFDDYMALPNQKSAKGELSKNKYMKSIIKDEKLSSYIQAVDFNSLQKRGWWQIWWVW